MNFLNFNTTSKIYRENAFPVSEISKMVVKFKNKNKQKKKKTTTTTTTTTFPLEIFRPNIKEKQ